jgi:L-serine dehydratase
LSRLRIREDDTGYGLIFAYALAVSEENAAGGLVVTARPAAPPGFSLPCFVFSRNSTTFPTQGYARPSQHAGLIGNFVKANASISGAEVGCQGEIGTACAMAAGAAAQILGGTPPQIEYAAEMGLEHHLGLTCDPVGGYVQIPCIERNAVAAGRAFECAVYALLSDGRHKISFDQVVETMAQTGKDLQSQYRETGLGGLAGNWDKYHRP